jgi:transketolase C-terminal domain/subunit
MADNTCHFGVNSFFADNGLSDVQSWLYFPADPLQMVAVIQRVFFERGLRFVFSTRSKVPYILKEDGTKFFGDGYEFVPGKDETIVEGKAGYVVSFGEMLYRSWDAVLRCRQQGLDVGLINKPTLNLVDEQTLRKIGSSPFVLVVESLNQKTGVRIRLCAVDLHTNVSFSLVRRWVLGSSSASSHPSMVTWARPRRAAVDCPSKFLTKTLTLNVCLVLVLGAD